MNFRLPVRAPSVARRFRLAACAGVTVANGAALGGNGTINREVVVEAGGALVGGAGSLYVDSLGLENGSMLRLAVDAPPVNVLGSAPFVAQTGLGLALGQNIAVFLTTGTGFGAGVYPLIQSSYTQDNSAGFSGWSITGLPSNYSATFQRENYGLNLVVTVPEPSTCAMALAGLACGGWSLLRRKRAGRRSAVRSSCCTVS